LTEGETGGHPITGRKWVRSSQRNLSRRLRGRICHHTVGRLLCKLGFSPRVNRKRFTGPPHPDRDRQFRQIQRQRKAFQRTGNPRISVDTKKKELIGNFKNAGRRWCRKADEVNAHDFPQDATCRAVPYAIYDEQHNEGHVRVGMSGDTAAFAVAAIRGWWRTRGRRRFPQAKRLLITADAGGSNSCRSRLWKRELQRWADQDGLEITVCHYPTGASKWNAVEHRLLNHISANWAGYPLRTLKAMLAFLRGTTTQTGLSVTAQLDQRPYPLRIKVPDDEMAGLNIRHQRICPSWNYTFKPRK
jgi:hypothetical protein